MLNFLIVLMELVNYYLNYYKNMQIDVNKITQWKSEYYFWKMDFSELKDLARFSIRTIKNDNGINRETDLKRIKKILNYHPKVNFSQGIKHFTDWVNTQEIENDNYDKSITELKEKGLYK